MNNDRFKFRIYSKVLKRYYEDNDRILYINGSISYQEALRMCLDDCGVIIEQCTGLKDENGKLIYEGDCFIYPIIPSDDCEGFLEEEKCYVKWFANSFCLVSMKTDEYIGGVCNCKKLKIISNIHENKE